MLENFNNILQPESPTENSPVDRIYRHENMNEYNQVITESPSTETPYSSPNSSPRKKFRFLPKTWHKIVFALFLVLLVLGTAGGVMAFYTLSVVKDLKAQGDDINVTAHEAYDEFKSQNLPGTEEKVSEIASKMQNVRSTYNKLAFYNSLPIAHNYFQDGIHGLNAADAAISAAQKSLKAVDPYADVLGFKGQGTFVGGTTEDRINKILETLGKIAPDLDNISVDLETMKSELAQIDANRYPETFQGKEVRSNIVKAQQYSAGAATALTQFRPVIDELPSIAGADGKRKQYLVLFENSGELRPTGGFMTAYADIYVENGKVTPNKSDDIYGLDKKFKTKIPIPDILGRYLTTETQFHLRDMNIDPDFRKSMDTFMSNYKLVPDEPHEIDGVIAVDTHVLTDLLKILGPVDVEGYGTFTAENTPQCDCPQIIYALSEITDKPTPFIKENRKGILGPMMRDILHKAYSAPKNLWPQLFQTGWDNIQGRHVQMYFFDTKAQQAAELINAAGRLQRDQNAQDFLAIIDANLGGAKSNLFITSKVKQEVSAPANGEITKKVTITYKNDHHADNCNLEAGQLCLNSTDRSWFRAYVPKGSKLSDSKGLTNPKQYDVDDFTVFEGEYKLAPMSQSIIELNYTVPYTDNTTYAIRMWKQAGVEAIPVIMDVNGGEEQLTLDKDTTYQAKF